jgi:hypothetical protein
MIEVYFHHCPRNSNKVVQELAKFAYNSKETHGGMVILQILFYLM